MDNADQAYPNYCHINPYLPEKHLSETSFFRIILTNRKKTNISKRGFLSNPLQVQCRLLFITNQPGISKEWARPENRMPDRITGCLLRLIDPVKDEPCNHWQAGCIMVENGPMKKAVWFLAAAFMIAGCRKEENERVKPEFIPTDVIVKIKGYYTMDRVFDFINSFSHEVESIKSAVYTSDLPAGSLQVILDHLNAKPYTSDGNGFRVTGYVHYLTGAVTLFPGLYNIRNLDYQADWLNTADLFRMKQPTEGVGAGCIVYFHVPEGEEKRWQMNFQQYEFVEWAELNYILEVEPRP